MPSGWGDGRRGSNEWRTADGGAEQPAATTGRAQQRRPAEQPAPNGWDDDRQGSSGWGGGAASGERPAEQPTAKAGGAQWLWRLGRERDPVGRRGQAEKRNDQASSSSVSRVEELHEGRFV